MTAVRAHRHADMATAIVGALLHLGVAGRACAGWVVAPARPLCDAPPRLSRLDGSPGGRFRNHSPRTPVARSCVRSRSHGVIDQPMVAAMGFFPGPFPVGHETVAEVIAIGDELSARRVGLAGARPVSGLLRGVGGLPCRALRRVSTLRRSSVGCVWIR